MQGGDGLSYQQGAFIAIFSVAAFFLAAFFLAAFMDVAELEAEMDRFPATTGGAAGRSGVDGSETTDKTTFQWPTITVSPWKN